MNIILFDNTFSGRLYDNCTVTVDCQMITHGICRRKKCACARGYQSVGPTGRLCSPDGYLNSPCVNSAGCHVINGTCIDGFCACPPGLVPYGKYRCVKIRLGDYCRSSADCSQGVTFSVCDNHACICADDAEFSSSQMACISTRDRDMMIISLCVLAIVILVFTIIILVSLFIKQFIFSNK